MTYLHGSAVTSHGYLDDSNCLVEGRFVLKVTGFGLPCLKDSSSLLPVTPTQAGSDRDYRALLWRAPELLRRVMSWNGTQKGADDSVEKFSSVLPKSIQSHDPIRNCIHYPSESIITHQNPSEPIRTHRNPSLPIRTHQNPSEPIKTHQNPSEPIRTHQNPSKYPLCDLFFRWCLQLRNPPTTNHTAQWALSTTSHRTQQTEIGKSWT